MRILFLTRYGRLGANSRYRLWQYQPLLERVGHRVDAFAMLDDRYLLHLYKRGRRPIGPVILGYLRHISRLTKLHRYDAVVLDQELLPYFPPFFEQLACRLNNHVVVDYDDAAYFKYRRHRFLRGRIGTIMRAAQTVVVGNHHLESYAKQYSPNVRLIPTVVDVEKYPVRKHTTSMEGVRICWIGTPVTAAEYLPPILPVLSELQKMYPSLSFRFIGAGQVSGAEGLSAEFLDWHESTEAKLISECDIGIMPLPDAEFQRGKCGLKLIQYMAAGIPVVGSPVGENCYLVNHGRNGLLSSDPRDWYKSLEMLIGDPGMRARMGGAGRLKVEREYSLNHGFDLWMKVFGDLGSSQTRSTKQLPKEKLNVIDR